MLQENQTIWNYVPPPLSWIMRLSPVFMIAQAMYHEPRVSSTTKRTSVNVPFLDPSYPDISSLDDPFLFPLAEEKPRAANGADSNKDQGNEEKSAEFTFDLDSEFKFISDSLESHVELDQISERELESKKEEIDQESERDGEPIYFESFIRRPFPHSPVIPADMTLDYLISSVSSPPVSKIRATSISHDVNVTFAIPLITEDDEVPFHHPHFHASPDTSPLTSQSSPVVLPFSHENISSAVYSHSLRHEVALLRLCEQRDLPTVLFDANSCRYTLISD